MSLALFDYFWKCLSVSLCMIHILWPLCLKNKRTEFDQTWDLVNFDINWFWFVLGLYHPTSGASTLLFFTSSIIDIAQTNTLNLSKLSIILDLIRLGCRSPNRCRCNAIYFSRTSRYLEPRAVVWDAIKLHILLDLDVNRCLFDLGIYCPTGVTEMLCFSRFPW